jgi:hypothetical protein
MSQANKCAAIIAGVVLASCTAGAFAAEVKSAGQAASAPATPVTIGDLIALQRKAIESDMTRQRQAAEVNVPAPTSTAPIAVVPAVKAAAIPLAAPARPPKPPEAAIVISGVMSFGGEWFAEVQSMGLTSVLRAGERVRGTPWTVASVQKGSASLMRPFTQDDIPKTEEHAKKRSGGKKAEPQRPTSGPVVRRFTFDDHVL